MEVLVLDGKNYVKASKAAKDLGYATDYVGQLCRSGQVDAHLIGRTWYVNQEQLSTHRVEKKRMSRVKAREYAKKSIEEHRLKVSSTQNNYKNIDIQYEADSNELIPETRKLYIASAEPTPKEAIEKKVFVKSEPARESEELTDDERYPENRTAVINQGEKIVMSGTVNIVDVTDEQEDLDMITLTPTRIRRSPTKKLPKESSEEDSGSDREPEAEVVSTPVSDQNTAEGAPNFLKRLQDREVTMETPENETTEQQFANVITQQFVPTQNSNKLYPYVLTVVIMLLITILSFPLTQIISYSDATPNKSTATYSYKVDEVSKIIRSKI